MINPAFPKLSERLEAAIRLAGSITVFADIGADHGLLSAALLRQNPEARALLTDISPKALEKARKLIARFGLEKRSAFYVGDGFAPLEGLSFSTAFILGMGGNTVSAILERGKNRIPCDRLILGGHTHMPLLRETVYRIGYHIVDESIVHENSRFYFLVCCEKGLAPIPTPAKLFTGEILPQTRPAEWLDYMRWQYGLYANNVHIMQQINHPEDEARLLLASQRLQYIRDVLDPQGSRTSAEGRLSL